MQSKARIEHLIQKAYNEKLSDNYEKAELYLLEALSLNKAHFGQDFKIDSSIISQLLEVYKYISPEKQESLLEEYGRVIWTNQHVDQEIAKILYSEKRYLEARTILRKYFNPDGEQLEPVKVVRNGPSCGTARLRVGKIARLFYDSVEKTSNSTNEEMNRIETERKNKFDFSKNIG